MNDRLGTWARRAVWALPVYGVLLAVGTITQQPDYRTDFAAYADYITTSTFLATHLDREHRRRGCRPHRGDRALRVDGARIAEAREVGFVSSAFGQIGLASLFGVAAFAQPAIGRAFLDGERAVAETINADVYGSPLFATAALSLLAFVAGGIFLGGAARRVGTWPRSAVTFTTSITVFAVGVRGGAVPPTGGGDRTHGGERRDRPGGRRPGSRRNGGVRGRGDGPMTAAGSVEKGVMIMQNARVFTATRIVALAVIGVLVVGLVSVGLGARSPRSRFLPERRPETWSCTTARTRRRLETCRPTAARWSWRRTLRIRGHD